VKKIHPMHLKEGSKLKPQYIHGLGQAITPFSTWAYEEGHLDKM
jgi:hypothetical protein